MIKLKTLIGNQVWQANLLLPNSDNLDLEKLINLWLINRVVADFAKSDQEKIINLILADADWPELLAQTTLIDQDATHTLAESLQRLQFVLKPSS